MNEPDYNKIGLEGPFGPWPSDDLPAWGICADEDDLWNEHDEDTGWMFFHNSEDSPHYA
jgi:hypothetical protein